jgi:hypothetical protein
MVCCGGTIPVATQADRLCKRASHFCLHNQLPPTFTLRHLQAWPTTFSTLRSITTMYMSTGAEQL